MYRNKVISKVEKNLEENVLNLKEVRKGINTVFIVSCSNNRYIFKIGTADNKSVKIEPYILNLLNKNGVPAPSVFWRGKIKTHSSFISEYLDGESPGYPYELSNKEMLKYSKYVGKVLGKIQSIQKPIGEFTIKDNKLKINRKDWETMFYNILEKFLLQAKSNYNEIGSEASRIAYRMDCPQLKQSSICPLDLHTDNIFFSKSGKIQGIIDMERVYIGMPRLAYDINLHCLCAGKESIEDKISEEFRKGYSISREVPEKNPIFKLIALLREMRAAHIWWDNRKSRRNIIKSKLEKIEKDIE